MEGMIEYDKLVRDRIPDRIRARGGSCETRTLNGGEFPRYLLEKLREETEEYLAAEPGEKKHRLAEQADISETAYSLVEAFGIGRHDLDKKTSMMLPKFRASEQKLRNMLRMMPVDMEGAVMQAAETGPSMVLDAAVQIRSILVRLAELDGFTAKDLDRETEIRRAKRGGFEKRILLIRATPMEQDSHHGQN